MTALQRFLRGVSIDPADHVLVWVDVVAEAPAEGTSTPSTENDSDTSNSEHCGMGVSILTVLSESAQIASSWSISIGVSLLAVGAVDSRARLTVARE